MKNRGRYVAISRRLITEKGVDMTPAGVSLVVKGKNWKEDGR